MIEIVEFPWTCMYCPTVIDKSRGEHIFPKRLGGALTLGDISKNNVCPRCNSGLSDIDRELCCRSHISLVASQELEADVYQAWDVDHNSYNLLVEAKTDWHESGALNSLYCYPQVAITPRDLQFRGDGEEMLEFGLEDFEQVMRKLIRRAYRDYRAGDENAINFEKIRTGTIHDGYWLPPRIFTRHSIWEIAKKVDTQSVILRFGSEKDKLRALNAMSEMTAERQFRKWGNYLGSRVPTIATFFDIGDTLRALMKNALNLVAAYCPNTPVNHDTFDQTMRYILGKQQVPNQLFGVMGFTKAADIQHIAVAKARSFRLVHVGGHWTPSRMGSPATRGLTISRKAASRPANKLKQDFRPPLFSGSDPAALKEVDGVLEAPGERSSGRSRRVGRCSQCHRGRVCRLRPPRRSDDRIRPKTERPAASRVRCRADI